MKLCCRGKQRCAQVQMEMRRSESLDMGVHACMRLFMLFVLGVSETVCTVVHVGGGSLFASMRDRGCVCQRSHASHPTYAPQQLSLQREAEP